MDSVWKKKIQKRILNQQKTKKLKHSNYEKNLHLHPGHPTDHRQK